jgi:hypothetical protein
MINAYYIAIIVFLVILIGYGLFNTFYKPTPKLAVMNNDTIDLSTQTYIMTADLAKQNFLMGQGATFCGFFKINAMDRTARYNSSVGYDWGYSQIIAMPNVWSLQIIPPTASASGVPACRLAIRTVSKNGSTFENLNLPSLPMQKWVHVAILREGRRFDVMFDNLIVGSLTCVGYPNIQTSPIVSGFASSGVRGSLLYPQVAPRRYTLTEVIDARKALSDTTGAPYTGGLKFPKFGCPGGLFCINFDYPSTGLNSWKSPYS